MKNHVDYMFSTEVKDIVVEDNQVKGVILNNEEVISFTGNIGNLQGSVGLQSYSTNVTFKRLTIN